MYAWVCWHPGLFRVTPTLAQGCGQSNHPRCPKELIRARFEFKLGGPDNRPEQKAYREAVHAVWFMVGTDASGKQARTLAFVRGFLNGNYRGRAIQHFCAGPRCCASEEEALEKALQYLPECLLPVKSIRIAQHRWTRLATVAPFGSSESGL